jgi:hypothetical protein
MSQLSTYGWEQPQFEVHTPAPSRALVEPSQRSIVQPILLTVPLFTSGVSLICGGLPILTDISWLLLTILCVVFLLSEMYRFSERFGIGGLILYGGVLTWFCYDYMTRWFLEWYPHWSSAFTPEIVAKSTAAHMLLVFCLCLGLRLRIGKWVPRLVTSLPEPRNNNVFFAVVLFTQIVGLIIPYGFFTSEPFLLAIYHAIVAGRGSDVGVAFTVGRSGNANYLWGGYVAQLIQVGSVGGVLAAYCVILLRMGIVQKMICTVIWVLWLLIAFGTGARGEVVFIMMPVAFFIFVRFSSAASVYFKRFSVLGYAAVLLFTALAICIVQIEYRYRNSGYEKIDFGDVSYTQLEGNHMFSEGLLGFVFIPQRHKYFYDDFPGETILLPIPDFLYYFILHPIPRALWWNKPIDPVNSWYNDVYMGGSGDTGGKVEGVTITKGLAGSWFFRFGVAGLIEGGLLYGWLMGCTERILLNSKGKTLPILAALCVATWIFRNYRDITFPEFYQFALGLGLMTLVVYPFAKRRPTADIPVVEE